MCVCTLACVWVCVLVYLYVNGLLCVCLSLGEGVGAHVGVLTRKKDIERKGKTKRERRKHIEKAMRG